MPLSDVFAALGGSRDGDAVVVLDLRLPRTMLGLLVGLALGVAGAVAQEITRNPLGDPGLIGVGTGCAFGVAAGAPWKPSACDRRTPPGPREPDSTRLPSGDAADP